MDDQRNAVNRYFASLGYTHINVNRADDVPANAQFPTGATPRKMMEHDSCAGLRVPARTNRRWNTDLQPNP